MKAQAGAERGVSSRQPRRVRVLIGSANPVKLAATEEAFGRYYESVEVEGVGVPSGVPDQPFGDETLRGAANRARALRSLERAADADFFVGIEGGVLVVGTRCLAFGGMCVVDRQGREGLGCSPHFQLPPGVLESLEAGAELGDIIDALADETLSKRRGGAIGYFSGGVMDRRELYVAGLVVALVPFVRPEHYFSDEAVAVTATRGAP